MNTPKTESIFNKKEIPEQQNAFILLCRDFEIALRKISNIQSGKGDEIEQAQKIARDALCYDN